LADSADEIASVCAMTVIVKQC